MNRRQAKKAFKKKCGMNPGEAAKLLPEILDGMAKTIRAAVEQIDTEQLTEYLQQYDEV